MILQLSPYPTGGYDWPRGQPPVVIIIIIITLLPRKGAEIIIRDSGCRHRDLDIATLAISHVVRYACLISHNGSLV